ncbi:MAG: TOBE domain-containing protein, partial [Desulfobacterales bacterium]
AIRPEKIQILTSDAAETNEIINRFTGTAEEIVYVGEARIYRISLAPELIIEVKVQSGPNAQKFDIGDSIILGWQTRHGLALK